MSISSIQLLPQSPESILHSPTDRLRILSLKKSLIDLAISALENFFIHCNLHEFDGHVGETLCQIRAYHIYSLRFRVDYYQNFLASLNKISVLKKISCSLPNIISHYQLNKINKGRSPTITDLLQNHNLICGLSELELYLIQLHLLSRFKFFDANGNAAIDYKNMCDVLNVSKYTARRIIQEYQITISQCSVDFIYSLIKENNNVPSWNIAFQHLKKIDEERRSVLPCYYVIETLYNDMLKKKCPILIVCERTIKIQHVDTIFLIFKPSAVLDGEYEYHSLNNIDLDTSCFVIEGIAHYEDHDLLPSKAQYINCFIKEGLRKMLLANMAIHPQYAGNKLSYYKIDPYLKISRELMERDEQSMSVITILKELHDNQQKMKNCALELGLTRENPAFFYIRHIFCDTISNQSNTRKVNIHEALNNSFALDESIDYQQANHGLLKPQSDIEKEAVGV